jgi:hypothetical protein
MSRKNTRQPPQPRLRGRGDYTAATKAITKPLDRLEAKIDHLESKLVKDIMSKGRAAETIGRTLGNFAGQGDLGALAGSQLAKWFGHGDYTLRHNSLLGPNPAKGATFSKDGKRGTRIMEREFIGDIVSGPLSGASTAFTVQNFVLNPTDSSTFPWLSRMASLFDQWEPNGIVFEFVSTSSEYNGTSQALGAVIMATDYDGYDPVYSSKQEMENADYSCSTKPSEGLLHGIECDPRERPTEILYTSTVNGAPITSTTLGTLQFATQGCSTAGVTLGELWVSYDITFFKKQMHESPYSAPTFISTGTTVAGGPYFPAAPLVDREISLEIVIGSGSRLRFNNAIAGVKYSIEYFLGNHTTVDETALSSGITTSGCTKTWQMAADSSALIVVYVVTTTAPDAWFMMPVNAADTSGYKISAVQVPSDYTF